MQANPACVFLYISDHEVRTRQKILIQIGSAMLIFFLKIIPPPTKRRELLDILRGIAGPISIETGFLACEVYEGSGDDQTVLYLEQWDSLDNLNRHIKSVPYTRLLAAMELSTTQPEVRFYETSQSWGMGLIESLRIPQRQKGGP